MKWPRSDDSELGEDESTVSDSVDTHSDIGSSDEKPDSTLDPESISDQTFPIAGRLMWIPPGGPPREVKPSEFQFDDMAAEAETARSCPECGAIKSIETIVREHVACGYVGVDGFVEADGEDRLACPKCGVEDNTGDRFAIVATVYSCVYCGQTLDRPLGRNGRGP